ncbi:MAG TPA: SDR family oxidoreductase [Pseudonocardiaceae bacterium]|jgi:NAD(P)H dehydrogenase (quinone)|nr:SDR family oxidoreductase [Pseudonocardiaceae bacterium]
MTIGITAATGQLGRLVVQGLLEQVPADELVLIVRDPAKAEEFAERGIRVRPAAYDQPEALASALAGVDALLLISGSEVGQRIEQHTNVVRAAKAAGVSRIAYTSVLRADTTPLILAPEHKATEEAIRESGIPFTFLRNGWYTENYGQQVADAVTTGTFVSSAGEGRVASATRADYAAAAVAVLVGEGHENKVYELSGDVAWTFDEFAAAITEAAGKPVKVEHVTTEQHKQLLADAGVPEATAGFVTALDAQIAEGLLADTTGDLSRLIGRPTTPLADTIPALLPA